MIINTNVPALNTYRQMGINQGAAQSAMEKLSSGLRINRAGDDAAGLAISEKMRAQVRGLDQASRNAQDGISMIQTAEGALQETHNILQRMRELATQAANDTNVEVDRNEIQKEMNALTSEINRIGNTTEFNTQNILDGGAKASGVSLSSTEAQGVAAEGGKITALKKVDFTNVPATAPATDQSLTISLQDADGAAKAFVIDGAAFKTLWDQTDAGKAGTSATDAMKREALVDVLGKVSSTETDFKMTDMKTTRTVTLAEVADIQVSDSGIFSIQSKIGGKDVTIADSTGATFDTLLGITTTAAIEGKGTAQEEAHLFGSKALETGDKFDAADWRGATFTVNYNGRDANITLAPEFGTATSDKVTTNEIKDAFQAALNAAFGADAITVAIEKNPNNVFDTNEYFSFKTDSSKVTGGIVQGIQPSFSIQGAHLDKILGDFVPGSSSSGGNFSATFQIGANQGQAMTIDIGDMRSKALGVSGLVSGGGHADVDGAVFTKASDVTNGTNNKGVEFALDVSSHEAATSAIKVINNAIETVSAQRSNLGAFQNRLEHTISNLDNASENLQAAESRIRDVDMAREVMEMTRANILGQASQAMLAQANQQPQSVLQLLG